MAAKLSISRAWDETREVLARDGRLMAIVALALIVLPSTIQSLVTPQVPPGDLPEPGSWMIVALVALVVGLVGQLAIIRLAIGPQTTVGDAIGHGARRAPAFLGAMLMWILPLVAIAFALAASARGGEPSPGVVLALLLVIAIIFVLAVRLMIASAVASAEPLGPVGILKRSWALTRGRWWRLFGFLLLFLVAALVVMIAVGAIAGILVGIVAGRPEPMSVGALIIALITQTAIAAVSVVFLVMIARIYLQLSGEEPAEATVPVSGT